MTLNNILLAWVIGLIAFWVFIGLLLIVRKTDEARARRAKPDPSEHIPEGWK